MHFPKEMIQRTPKIANNAKQMRFFRAWNCSTTMFRFPPHSDSDSHPSMRLVGPSDHLSDCSGYSYLAEYPESAETFILRSKSCKTQKAWKISLCAEIRLGKPLNKYLQEIDPKKITKQMRAGHGP